MKRLAGLPVARIIGKYCDPAYCGNGNGFKFTFEQMKEKF